MTRLAVQECVVQKSSQDENSDVVLDQFLRFARHPCQRGTLMPKRYNISQSTPGRLRNARRAPDV